MRLLALVCTLVIATTAGAQQPATTDPSGSPPAPGTSKLAPAKGAKPAPPKPLTKSEQQIMDVQTAKARFMAAIGSCPRPESCDAESPGRDPELVKMLKTAEDGFMVACVQCASDKGCEDERVKIRSGRGKFGYNVCVIEAQKGTGKKPAATGSKGSGTATPKAPAPAATARPAAQQGTGGSSK